MKVTALSIPVVCLLFSCTLRGAEPLAQQYVVVHKVRDLDDPAKAVCVGTPDILQLPSGRLIASMELWLKRPTSGDEGGIDYPNHCKIKASDDGGRTWQQISTNGITWGSLFYVNDALHMIGNDPHKRDIRIIRSPDDGKTWSKPVTLFDDSRYHSSATPVHVKDGFVYRAFEDMDRGSASLVVAGDLSKDLLDPAAWRMSNKVEPPRDTPSLSRSAATKKDGRDSGGNWFLEGNVIEIRGELYVLLRTRIDVQLTAGMTSVCKLEDDGRTMKYRFVQFYPMPGGQNKFKILYDKKSGLFWTCSTMVPDPYQPPDPLAARGFSGTPGNMRRILMLNYSIDGLNWFQTGCVAMSRNPLESFHYSSQVIVGDDLLVLSRSSIGAANQYRDYTWNSGAASGKAKLPYNNHDSNMITLHRVKNFRSLALDLKPDFDATASNDEVNSEQPSEVEDGRSGLLINMRNHWGRGGFPEKSGKRLVARSFDGGASWDSEVMDAALPEPPCQASLCRYSFASHGEPSRLLFANPIGPGRANLRVRLSLDEGKTWPHGKLIAVGPAAYSCMARLPGNRVGIVYESGNYQRVSFSAFPIDGLMQTEFEDR